MDWLSKKNAEIKKVKQTLDEEMEKELPNCGEQREPLAQDFRTVPCLAVQDGGCSRYLRIPNARE